MPEAPLSEGWRKAVHIGAGAPALLLRYLEPWQAMGIAALAVVFNAAALPRLSGRRLERPDDRQRGYARGILFYPLSVLLLLLLFPHRLEIVAAAWGILAFGDGMGTVVGGRIGGRTLPWNPGKTVVGSAAFFLFGTVGSTVLYLFVRPSGVLAGPPWWNAAILCLLTAAVCALLEGIPWGIDDNLIVPLLGAGFLYCLTLVRPGGGDLAGSVLLANLALGILCNGFLAWMFLNRGFVDRSGTLAGFWIGTLVFTFGGWRGYAVLLLFFALGTAATRVGFRRKESLGIAQEKGGARSARHAVANCSLALFWYLMAFLTPYREMFVLAAVAAFATAAFDTVSSEIGQLSSRGTILITTLRRVPPGTEGAVSPAGTGAGLLAAAILAATARALGLLESLAALEVVIGAAFVGGMLESILGAALEKGDSVNNEAVNFLNTLFGSLIVLGAARWVL